MLDCGAGSLHALALRGLPWELMSHLFVSHFHVDHIGELASLMFAFRYGMKTPRDAPFALMGPRGLDRVVEGLKLAFGEKIFESQFPFMVQMIDPGESVQIGINTRLLVAKTPHTPESLAVRIESEGRSVCYTGDTGYDEELAKFFHDTDLLVSECSFTAHRDGVAHLGIADAAKLAMRAGAKRLMVTHFYFDPEAVDIESEIERVYDGEVIVARDGLEIGL
jgi:ribonuclease BN (tRNA processing enzyme)